MEHYVTLFDVRYLPQGLALHTSLSRHATRGFVLWVLCMDEQVKALLDSLGCPTIRTVPLAEIETPALLATKAARTRAEYCWTLTPFTPSMVFARDPAAQRVTYLDADMYFLKSPQPIFDEFERSAKAVLITDHAYDAEYDLSATSGKYCVQFMTFMRATGEPVLKWWQDRCIEWCFNRYENGKFGDQKYLDDWPERFPELVHVLERADLLLAPWNARRFPYSKAVAWHFHGLRILRRNRVLMHRAFPVPAVVDRHIYMPYLQELKLGLGMIEAAALRPYDDARLAPLGVLFRNLAQGLRRAYRSFRRDIIH